MNVLKRKIMKTTANLKTGIRLTVATTLLLGVVIFSSCSHRTCSAYAHSKDRVNYVQSRRQMVRGGQSIPLPYTADYRAKMYRKNF